MTKEQLAQALDGLQSRKEPAPPLLEAARRAGLVILYGASDDLLEIRGAFSEEYGATDGQSFWFTPAGIFDEDACYSECCYFREARDRAEAEGGKITVLWCEEAPYSWTYRTAIPHATFDILEDNERYCRGIVFALLEAVDVDEEPGAVDPGSSRPARRPGGARMKHGDSDEVSPVPEPVVICSVNGGERFEVWRGETLLGQEPYADDLLLREVVQALGFACEIVDIER